MQHLIFVCVSSKFPGPIGGRLNGRFAAEEPLEGLPEFRTENGVDDGVEGGIEVAQPQKYREHRVVKDPMGEEGHEEGADEERQPADHEGARDDGQRLGRLPLSFRLERFAFPFDRFRRFGS